MSVTVIEVLAEKKIRARFEIELTAERWNALWKKFHTVDGRCEPFNEVRQEIEDFVIRHNLDS